jgi:hypothetical protein
MLAASAAVIASFAGVSPTTANAAPPAAPDEVVLAPEATPSYPRYGRYYGSIDPNPIGYYPYAYYQGPAFPVQRAFGYYPYPDAHPYVNPIPFPYGYWGYGAWPYGFPGWGWGTVYPYGPWF